MEKVHFTTFNYCVRPLFNLDLQNQEYYDLQISKPFACRPWLVCGAVFADVAPSRPPSWLADQDRLN